jgi:hypothetical protein
MLTVQSSQNVTQTSRKRHTDLKRTPLANNESASLRVDCRLMDLSRLLRAMLANS